MTPHPPAPSSSDDLPWELLGRHFAGELSAAESRELERWIAAEPERAAAVGRLGEIWWEADQREAWNADAALRRIKQAPAGPARVIELPAWYRDEPEPRWRRAGRAILRVAAAVAVVVGGAWGWRAASRWSRHEAQQIATSEVATPRGQRASLRLPDGTRVVLGPSSTIRYAIARDHGPRAVQLEGAAYFVVIHDSTRPFTVRTARGMATDLGTRFQVQAYAGDTTVDVVVAEGRVALAGARDAGAAGLLAAGDLGQITGSGRVAIRHGVPTDRYLAWTEGRLEFRDTPMRDVVVQLERWYDLDLRLGDSAIARKRLSASFKSESAAEVVRLIAASLDLQVDEQGTVVTLRSK